MIAITAADGIFDPPNEPLLIRRVFDAMADAIDATDAPAVSSLIGVTLDVLPKHRFTMGGVPARGVRIDVAVPSVALSTFSRRRRFIKAATAAAIDLSTDPLNSPKVIVRIMHLVDGGWGTDGNAVTNDDIDESISEEAPPT